MWGAAAVASGPPRGRVDVAVGVAAPQAQETGQTEQAVLYYRKSIQWGDDDPAVRQALDELTRGGRRGFFGKTG